ncbi:MAG: hypothetical protein RLZZ611_688 [Cyanobacteriota bacterium]
MQVLYQLSYGPVWIECRSRSGVRDRPLGRCASMQKAYTAAGRA